MTSFQAACRFVLHMPCGYNSDRDDPMALFREGLGTCSTKHGVIATLAEEMDLPVGKTLGICRMTEALVTGTEAILAKHGLPCLSMIHCFLAHGDHRVDLTEGNRNGKNGPVDEFLFTREVVPNFTEKDEYLLYRQVLSEQILTRNEFQGVDLRTVLQAKVECLALLRARLDAPVG